MWLTGDFFGIIICNIDIVFLYLKRVRKKVYENIMKKKKKTLMPKWQHQEFFFRVFPNKHKLYNLIKRKFCILTTTIIKKYANT